MTLSYDFDIFDVIPGPVLADPGLNGFLTEIGFRPDHANGKIALFRDPRTAEALRHAPAVLRDFFIASGFGLNTYASGAPHGRYPAKDEDARLEIIRRLTENAENAALPKVADQVEGVEPFRLEDFLAELTRAEPIDDVQGFTHIHDLSGRSDVRAPAMPPMFDTHQSSGQATAQAEKAPRKKFWQNRFFVLAAAMAMVAVVVQLASGSAILRLASL